MNIKKERNDYLATQRELVEAHVDHCSPLNFMAHVSIGGDIVNNRFEDREAYMDECKQLSSVMYEMLAARHFRARMIYFFLRDKAATEIN